MGAEPRGFYADLLPPRHVVDIRAELAGAAFMLEAAARDIRSGDTAGLALSLEVAARNARAALDRGVNQLVSEGVM